MNRKKTAQASASCAKCGTCVPVCPLFKLHGRESLAARGKLHLLQKIPLQDAGPGYAEILSRCLLCGACSSVCPRNLDIVSLVGSARAELPAGLLPSSFTAEIVQTGMRHGTIARLVGDAARLLDRGLLRLLPADSGLRLKMSLPDAARFVKGEARSLPQRPSPADTGSENPETVSLFEGCFARYLQKEITDATAALLTDRLHLVPMIPEEQKCCGLSFNSAGQHRQALDLAKRNIEAFSRTSGPILVSCASCFSHLRSYPSLFADDPAWHQKALAFAARLRELSSFLLDGRLTDQLARTPRQATVYFHDSCHLRFHNKITAPPRILLRSIPALRLAEPTGGYQCCGAGGLFHLYHPESAGSLRAELMKTVAAMEVSHALTTCSGCLLYLHQGVNADRLPVSVQHFAVFLAELFD